MFQSKTMRMWKWQIHLRSSNKVPKWWSWANKRSWSCSSKFSPRPGRANEMYTPQSQDLLHLISGIFLSSGKCCPGPAGPRDGSHTYPSRRPMITLWCCSSIRFCRVSAFRFASTAASTILPGRSDLTSQQSLQPLFFIYTFTSKFLDATVLNWHLFSARVLISHTKRKLNHFSSVATQPLLPLVFVDL